jgi:hypothetical protein
VQQGIPSTQALRRGGTQRGAMVCARDETVIRLGAPAGGGPAMGQTRLVSAMAQSGGSVVRPRYWTTSGVYHTPRVAHASRGILCPQTERGGGSAVWSYQGAGLGREYRQGWAFEGRIKTRGPFPHGRLLVHGKFESGGGIRRRQERPLIIADELGKVKPNERASVPQNFALSCRGAVVTPSAPGLTGGGRVFAKAAPSGQ